MRQALARLARGKVVLLAALGSLSLVAAFAGSSGAAQAHKASAKPATWVIGNIGTYSGINDSNFVGGAQTLEAWALYTNAHGGLDGGHHIKVISMDDAGNATTSENDVKQLVADHVLAQRQRVGAVVGEAYRLQPGQEFEAENGQRHVAAPWACVS